MAPFSTNDNSMMWQETNMFVIIGSEISYITYIRTAQTFRRNISSGDASSFDFHLLAFFERFQCSVNMYACSKQMQMMVVKRTMMAEVKG